jgi:MFS family permease
MKSEPSPLLLTPTRVRFGVLAFACALSMITYLDRVCISQVAPTIQQEFDLTESQVGWLFFAFAFAYAVFEVPSGWLGDVFGPRRTLIRIVLWWSVFTALTGSIYPQMWLPGMAFAALFAVRFLFGVGEAGAYPNIARSFHNWFPFGERGSAQGAVWMAGRLAGGATPFVVLGLLRVVEWRHTFWMFGALGAVWCVAFWWWFRDRPEDHPAVNAAELAHIRERPPGAVEPKPLFEETEALPPSDEEETGIRTADTAFSPASPEGIRTPPAADPPAAEPAAAPAPEAGDEPSHRGAPWRRILTSVNLWALCLMYFCASYGWYFNITWLPKYLGSHYGITEKTHGFWLMSLLAGAPLLLGSLACLVGGLLTDRFIRRTGNRKWGRRLFGVVGHGICALCYFLSLFAGSAVWFVVAIALASFWNDLTMGSAWASCLDIGKRFSGIVSGCMNTVGNLGGAMAGISTGLILDAYGQDWGWQVNLFSYGLVYVLAMLLWLYFDATKALVDD